MNKDLSRWSSDGELELGLGAKIIVDASANVLEDQARSAAIRYDMSRGDIDYQPTKHHDEHVKQDYNPIIHRTKAHTPINESIGTTIFCLGLLRAYIVR